ncbi:MAG: peptide-N4-asparagine amidase, partial [Candidatus Aramenus sulfurataquae]
MKRLALIYLLFLSLGVFLFVTPADSSSTTPVLQHPFIPTNVTVSSTVPFKQDPVFYSFEAYHLQPPNVTPVKVVIAKDLIFNDTGLKPYYLHVYVPPGNYSTEILNVTIKEFNGTQYDRPVYVFADGVPIFWGSTQEINNSTAEADVTVFENLLRGNVTFEAVIQNYYDAKVNITGLYELNMTLYLYPGAQPKGLPNAFIPLFVNATVPYNYSYVVLSPLEDSYTCAVTIPN